MYNTLIIGLALAGAQADNAYQRGIEYQVIGLADLDLNTSAGKTQLERRIRDACGEASNVDIEAIRNVRNCRDDAEAQAMYVVKSRLSQRTDVQLAVR